jgi:hypothetical protein
MWLPEFLHHVGVHDAYGKDQAFSRNRVARSQPAQTSKSHPTCGCYWIDAECSYASGAHQKRPAAHSIGWKIWLIEAACRQYLTGQAFLARGRTREVSKFVDHLVKQPIRGIPATCATRAALHKLLGTLAYPCEGNEKQRG